VAKAKFERTKPHVNIGTIGHIDHGKTTLSDRLLETTRTVSAREQREQHLDSLDLERERGITIKAKAVRMEYQSQDGQSYELNLLDTPGHVDFGYEVGRALAAGEGAILVVDASQGIEAQTLANVYLALENDLTIIPVLNKIDLPGAEPDHVAQEIEEVLGLPKDDVLRVSAKAGTGIHELLEAIVERVPPPHGQRDQPLRALIFDSHYDAYKGVIAYVRVMDGVLPTGARILLMGTQAQADILELGAFRPAMTPLPELGPGEVGYIATGLKDVGECQVGDTVTLAVQPAAGPLAGYRPAKPMVFAGLYPVESNAYVDLREALEKLKLNDAALVYEPETSAALGFGFRCGFLGMLHMEIIQERLEREYDLNLITTAPTVVYEVLTKEQKVVLVDNPSKLPDPNQILEVREPICRANILVPQQYLGGVINLCVEKRGVQKDLQFHGNQASLVYELPMSEVVLDFFDRLKSVSRGYASLDYGFERFEPASVVRLDILINGDKVDALAVIVHRQQAQQRGRQVAEKLRELIPRQIGDVAIQAAIGGQVLARTTVKALRKNVTAKCYGGDVSRKRKLLEKQKEGKKRMKQLGSVEVPQEAFLAVLKVDK